MWTIEEANAVDLHIKIDGRCMFGVVGFAIFYKEFVRGLIAAMRAVYQTINNSVIIIQIN